MFKLIKAIVLFVLWFIALPACKLGGDKKAMHFGVVSDSIYVGPNGYNEKLSEWKQIYEQCMQNELFSDALYMGLQDSIHIGSISNRGSSNINDPFTIFDTSNRQHIASLFAIIKRSNCYTELNASEEIQQDFYNELTKSLNSSKQYQYLTQYIDTNHLVFKIATLADNSLRPDSLNRLLQRTEDTSLLHFRQKLVAPGNALLVRTAMVLGFRCEFPMTKKLPSSEEAKFKDEVPFYIGDTGHDSGAQLPSNASIRLLSNGNLQITINKYYTVFGQFYRFEEEE